MKSISLDSPESSEPMSSVATAMRPTGSGPSLTMGKADGVPSGGRRYGGLLNVLRSRVSTTNLLSATSSSSSSATNGGAQMRITPPANVTISATSAPASYNQCNLDLLARRQNLYLSSPALCTYFHPIGVRFFLAAASPCCCCNLSLFHLSTMTFFLPATVTLHELLRCNAGWDSNS